MANTEAIKQAITQAAIYTANSAVLAINGESRRQSTNIKQMVHQRSPGTRQNPSRENQFSTIMQKLSTWHSRT